MIEKSMKCSLNIKKKMLLLSGFHVNLLTFEENLCTTKIIIWSEGILKLLFIVWMLIASNVNVSRQFEQLFCSRLGFFFTWFLFFCLLHTCSLHFFIPVIWFSFLLLGSHWKITKLRNFIFDWDSLLSSLLFKRIFFLFYWK